jgi:hypothetical protein
VPGFGALISPGPGLAPIIAEGKGDPMIVSCT